MLRMGFATLAFACLALILAGCDEAKSQPTRPDPAAGEARAVTTNEYVRRSGTADLFEIQAGNLALRKSDREDIRALARMLVDDHTRAGEALKEAVGKTLGITTPPTRLDSAHESKLQRLQAADGQEFNRLYLEIQKQGHEEAVALHRSYAKLGDNAALKVAAREFASMVEKHLEEMQKIGGSQTAPPPRG